MIGDLIVSFAWRFAWALRPILHDLAQYRAWCHHNGILGAHQPDAGRCTTCRRRT